MRRIGLLVGLLVLALVFVTEVLADGGTTIMGYGPKEFAIKSDPDPDKNIEQQADELRLLIMHDNARKPNTRLHIWIEGFADKTGPEAENDEWGDKRRRQMNSFLSHKFPDAKVESISRGTSRNMRAVFVEWKYVPIPVTPAPVAPAPVVPQAEKPAKQSFNIVALSLVAIILAIILCVVIFVLPWKISKNKEPKSGTRWLNVTVNGEKYSVVIEFKDGKFISPFKSRSGSQIVRDDLKGIVDSLKGCLTKDEFAQQKIELIRKGIINVVGER